MHKSLRGLAALILIGGLVGAAGAQDACDPFTTTAPANAVVIGTRITFTDWAAYGTVQRPGVVEEYAVRACWPGGWYPPGLDDVAYVISYGDIHGARVVLNRNQFEVSG